MYVQHCDLIISVLGFLGDVHPPQHHNSPHDVLLDHSFYQVLVSMGTKH